MTPKRLRIELKVAKWGNSLAVRLPAKAAAQIGVGEGDSVVAEVTADGCLTLTAEAQAVSAAAVGRLRRLLARQKVSAPVVGEMRRDSRY